MMATGTEVNDSKHLWVKVYLDWVFRWRWSVIAASCLAVLMAGYGTTFLRIDSDIRIFFNPDGPEMRTLQNLESTYSKLNSVIFVVVPRSGDVFTKKTLVSIADLTDQAQRLPYTTRVDSLTNYSFSEGRGDDFIINDLVPEPNKLDQIEIERVRKIALAEPTLVSQIISPKGDVTAVYASVVLPENKFGVVESIADTARKLASTISSQNPDIEVHLTGSIMADDALAEAAHRDLKLTPIMMVLVVITLWFGLRSAYSMIATMIIVVLSMVVAIGWAGWSGLVLNDVTVGAPVMSMTLAIADCVHLLAGAGQLQREGRDQRSAIIESMRVNWTPVLMTSVTTAVGFLAVNFSDSPPIQDVGNIVAVGVIAAWVLSVTLFPALLIVLPAPTQLPVLSDPKYLTSVSRLILRYRKPILIGSTILVCALATGILRIKPNDDFIQYFSNAFEFRRDTDLLQNRLTGLHRLLYSVPSGSEGGISDPAYLKTLDDFAEWFRGRGHVTHVTTVSDVVKRINRDMHQNDPAYFRVPANRDLVAQYLLLYEMSLPAGYDINDQLDIAKSSSLVAVNVANVSSVELRRLAGEGEAWLKARGRATPATGISIMYSTLTENNIKAMMYGVVVELVAISFLMIFMLRSIKIGLISLVPNLVPAILAFGFWGWIGYEVNLAVSTVAAITFGIVVDDTIHSLTKYMRARRDLKMNTRAAVEYTYVAAGDPMILTGLTLILGFGVLAFSDFAVSHQMGLLSASIIALAIVADLVLLPPLLMFFDRKDQYK